MEREENHKDYEIGFLLKEESDFRGLSGVLKQHEATVSFESPLKKIPLAYEIKKQTSAYFGFVRFSAPAERLPELEHALIMDAAVIRFLIVKYTPGQPVVSPQVIPGVAPEPDPSVKIAEVKEPQQSTVSASLPLTNEDLERRIEEILK